MAHKKLHDRIIRLVAIVVLLAVHPLVIAQQGTQRLPPPDAPQPLQEGQVIEPEVTIIERDEGRIEEFRIQGRMYMVRVSPQGGGAPYYLLDTDGDGTLESYRGGIEEPPAVPQWILFSW